MCDTAVLIAEYVCFRYDDGYVLTADSGHRVGLDVQSSSGGCDDRLEAYEGSMYCNTTSGAGVKNVVSLKLLSLTMSFRTPEHLRYLPS